ncbi:DUF3999 domain-containing protein [Echinicola strongylocentroti]|uniref:DUF3999 domain-containing protein n=1 Tax=Echinicola strongylocentroti TaxID=1795355 RepID=A0A2Z4IPJ8_9BACT|nr:DUF3999 family protein [Echinicola strongylocentroti]AWW32825.1 DUF3999 domain-containing protein [Echinicola strongylocentroti]
MRPIIKLLIPVYLLVSQQALGQIKDYAYMRELEGITDTWHQIDLPDDIFGKVDQQLDDIRIYGITAQQDTIEAPYLLRSTAPKADKASIDFKLLNTSQSSGHHFYTFEVAGEAITDHIALDIGRQNFDWKVKLEGSHDQKEWFTLLEDYRILSIKNTSTDFRFTTLDFPAANYPYYRLAIPSSKNPNLQKATLERQVIEKGTYQNHQVASIQSHQNDESKSSQIEVKLSMPVPISQVKININEDFDYYRPVTISYLSDSVQIEKGWHYQYRQLASGMLNSLSGNQFDLPPTTLQQLRITIHNQDNTPLTVNGVEAKGFDYMLIARFTTPADYFLVYGQANGIAPHYDIAQFTENIPSSPKALTLKPPIAIQSTPAAAPLPLFGNKAWLWAIMAIIIVVLGWFSLKMIKKA